MAGYSNTHLAGVTNKSSSTLERCISRIAQRNNEGDTLERTMKILAITVLALATLAALLIIYISVSYDANSLRPEIEKMALSQGYTIDIEGDLEWKFLPNPGISVGQLSWGNIQQTSGSVDRLVFTVLWGGMFEMLAAREVNSASADTEDPQAKNQRIAAFVDSIQVHDASIVLQTPEFPAWHFSNIQLRLHDLSMKGERFPVDVELRTLGNIELQVAASLAIDLAAQTVSIDDLDAVLGDAKLRGDLKLDGAQATASGTLQLQNVNLKKWLGSLQKQLPLIDIPRTFSRQALTAVGTNIEYNLDANGLSSIDAQIDIDGQILKLTANSDDSTGQLRIAISAARFAAGNYLSPADDSQAGLPAKSPNTALFAPLAPLLLWPGQAQMEFTLDTLQMNGYEINNLYANLFSNRHVVRLASLNADLFGGQLNALGRIDLSGAAPQLNLQPSLTGIDLAAALPALADNHDLNGRFSLEVDIQGRGRDSSRLLSSLTGSGQFKLLNPRYANVNIEQMFCSSTRLLSGGGLSNQQWPEGTDLQDIVGSFHLQNSNLLLDNLTTGVGNLNLAVKGTVAMPAGTYRIEATTRLDGTSTSSNGCSVNKNFRNRAIPFVCSGSFYQEGDPTCRPDSSNLSESLKNKVLQKLGDKLLGKDGEDRPDVTELFKGLFK